MPITNYKYFDVDFPRSALLAVKPLCLLPRINEEEHDEATARPPKLKDIPGRVRKCPPRPPKLRDHPYINVDELRREAARNHVYANKEELEPPQLPILHQEHSAPGCARTPANSRPLSIYSNSSSKTITQASIDEDLAKEQKRARAEKRAMTAGYKCPPPTPTATDDRGNDEAWPVAQVSYVASEVSEQCSTAMYRAKSSDKRIAIKNAANSGNIEYIEIDHQLYSPKIDSRTLQCEARQPAETPVCEYTDIDIEQTRAIAQALRDTKAGREGSSAVGASVPEPNPEFKKPLGRQYSDDRGPQYRFSVKKIFNSPRKNSTSAPPSMDNGAGRLAGQNYPELSTSSASPDIKTGRLKASPFEALLDHLHLGLGSSFRGRKKHRSNSESSTASSVASSIDSAFPSSESFDSGFSDQGPKSAGHNEKKTLFSSFRKARSKKSSSFSSSDGSATSSLPSSPHHHKTRAQPNDNDQYIWVPVSSSGQGRSASGSESVLHGPSTLLKGSSQVAVHVKGDKQLTAARRR